MNKVDLSKYDNSWYMLGGSILKRGLWYFTNLLLFKNKYIISTSVKVLVLRSFGCKVGRNVVIKPGVNIKYPWLLEIGDNSWIGEDVWIDNIASVVIGSNVCISQGALILCGNHNYTTNTFDLMVGTITLEEGSWVGAKAVVCPGVKMYSHSVLTVGSIASKDLEAYSIYKGNPAIKIKERIIKEVN